MSQTERNDYVRDSKDALLVGAFRFLAKSLLDKSSHEPTSTVSDLMQTRSAFELIGTA